MAKSKQQSLSNLKQRKQKKAELSHLHLALSAKNYIIIAVGIGIIILGYIFMSENSVSGFLPTTIAPILLIFGYCVVVPFGILFKEKNVTEAVEEEVKTTKAESKPNVVQSSNIKTS